MESDNLIKRIRYLMEHLGCNESQFAKLISIDKSNLSKIMSGQRTTGTSIINKIIIATQCNADWIKNGVGDAFDDINVVSEPIADYSKSDNTIILELINIINQQRTDIGWFKKELDKKQDMIDILLSGKIIINKS